MLKRELLFFLLLEWMLLLWWWVKELRRILSSRILMIFVRMRIGLCLLKVFMMLCCVVGIGLVDVLGIWLFGDFLLL